MSLSLPGRLLAVMRAQRWLVWLVSLAWLALSPRVHAQLNIEISGAGANRIPIAVTAFVGDSAGESLSAIVRADLERSGLFRLIDAGTQAIGEQTAVDASWKGRGADALVSGTLFAAGAGRSEVRFRVYDVARDTALGSMAIGFAREQWRLGGHRVADFVFEKLLGERGVFSTRIAYVAKVGGRYELQVADADGQNAQTALRSMEPIISPAWSPDGTRLAYVSFERKKPIVYVHQLSTGQRQVVANFRGSNSAPTWSPDGRRLALVLTKDGGSQIYVINADGSTPIRITNSSGIDTEPQFSADGQWLYFTSDRGGSPQIYRVAATGGTPERISFEGNYNVTPRPSPDGKSLAFVTRQGGRFQIALLDLATRQMQILTDSQKDESPSFAPNGRSLIYATEIGGRGVLATVSSDGRVKQRLSAQAGDIREPAWGPYPRF